MLQQALFLAGHGVPFDVAFALEPHEALAFSVVVGRIQGGNWSWESMQWLDPEGS